MPLPPPTSSSSPPPLDDDDDGDDDVIVLVADDARGVPTRWSRGRRSPTRPTLSTTKDAGGGRDDENAAVGRGRRGLERRSDDGR
jgi:DNA gyrase/topoisomerase IV subunit B